MPSVELISVINIVLTLNTKSKQFFYQNVPLKEVVGNFLEYIQFHKIPANVLMREIHPLGLVPYSIIMNALAYQVRFNWSIMCMCWILYRIAYLVKNLIEKHSRRIQIQSMLEICRQIRVAWEGHEHHRADQCLCKAR